MEMSYDEAIKRIDDHIRVHRIGEWPHIYIGQALQIAKAAIREAQQREAGCEYCAGESKLYQQTYDTKLYINTFGRARTIENECTPCPPFSKCSMRGIPARSAFIINFCPECGRKLGKEVAGADGKGAADHQTLARQPFPAGAVQILPDR